MTTSMANIRLTTVIDFHFTLGPVQSFVAQARRTRDFWAGSFLLAWLSGVAMAATQEMGGELVFPLPPTGYLDWICNHPDKREHALPVQGGVPNRFLARVPPTFDPQVVSDAVRRAWFELAEHVWKHDLAWSDREHPICRTIWLRQHESFWEMSWALGHEGQTDLLDRRKNWRSHFTGAEPGSKCHLMEGWQELSGVDGVSARENRQRLQFWARARQESRSHDFSESEMLCALAWVKRRFVRHFESFQAEIDLQEGDKLALKGWKLPANQPSVVYMAAVHWLEQLLQKCSADPQGRDRLQEVLDQGRRLVGFDEWHSKILCLEQAAQTFDPQGRSGRLLVALDGSLFFETMRARHLPAERHEQAEAFGRALDQVTRRWGLGSPTPFYAILMMDGDRLGVHMSQAHQRQKVSQALNLFTARVNETVFRHHGHLIYAGGDDVLAVLPLEDALTCAAALLQDYLQSFEGTGLSTTLSGGIIYAHVKTALGEVLRQAHLVLDEVAKEATGRDAIAVRVLKPGGEHLEWCQPWEKVLDAQGRPHLQKLYKEFQTIEREDVGFSSKFFYKVRARLADLETFEINTRYKLLRSDFVNSISSQKAYPPEVRRLELSERQDWLDARLADLMNLCKVYVRTNEQCVAHGFSAGGLMLIRFLAQHAESFWSDLPSTTKGLEA